MPIQIRTDARQTSSPTVPSAFRNLMRERVQSCAPTDVPGAIFAYPQRAFGDVGQASGTRLVYDANVVLTSPDIVSMLSAQATRVCFISFGTVAPNLSCREYWSARRDPFTERANCVSVGSWLAVTVPASTQQTITADSDR